MMYVTRPMRQLSPGKLQGDLWRLTVPGSASLMKQRLHTISQKKDYVRVSVNKPMSARELACTYAHMDDVCIIAKNKVGNYIGWACVWGFKSKPGPRIMLYVASQYRKKGIGSTLLSRSIAYLKRKGYRSIYAEPWNDKAAAFFKKHGFVQDSNLSFFSAKLNI